MSDISRKRELIKQAYPSPTWAAKVNKMTDNQVIAVLMKLRRQGKLP